MSIIKKEEIIRIALDNNITHTGFVRGAFSEPAEKLSNKKTVMMPEDIAGSDYEWVNTFIVCLLPYFSGGERSRISRYAWGEDYHAVMHECLSPLRSYLEENGCRAQILCDNHKLNDRYLAYKAGLGFLGKNGFLINDDYGTYTFIGSVATSAEISSDCRPSGKSCLNCGGCKKSCPGGAISDEGVCVERCVSYLTQKKGELTAEEVGVIKKSGYIWGCDICQEVCPHNKYAKKTNIHSFTDNLTRTVSIDKDISNREFKRKYSKRAFAWRGKRTLLRNMDIFGK
ncbi:MAG: epoxyqueuosine reductase [Oscillospiraceae bacterium]|nr:epoxyqueuosine reductase [Oscillospiraceae bacterium]